MNPDMIGLTRLGFLSGSFLSVTKQWDSGDHLTLQLPINLRTEAIKGLKFTPFFTVCINKIQLRLIYCRLIHHKLLISLKTLP
jgi:hypothetical protein